MPVGVADDIAADQARFLGNYTRKYNAGAFAHPMASELAEHPEMVTDERHKADLSRVARWTTLARELPALTSVVQSVPWWARTERVRLLRMQTGQLGRHTDITDRAGGTRDGQVARFHIPLVTDPAIKMSTWDLDGHRREMHLQQWHCYYLDARKPHAVANPTPVSRVHLVVDVIVNSAVRSAIAESYARSC